MGVSLERVQNKFACIIGELCSEPMVLSQFAIWLDLRLAEYKAKGSISLEISGEDPDPIWLKGHKPAAQSTQERELTADMYDPTGGGGTNYDRDNTDYQDRLSPEIVMVKDDPEVFPVSLHGNARLGSPHLKRKLSDSHTLSSGSNLHRSSISSSPSPAKLHRPSPSSTHSAPANESLMSIISGGDDGSQIYETPESQSSVQSTQQAMGDNSLSGYAVSLSDTPESSSPLPSTSNTGVADLSTSDTTDYSATVGNFRYILPKGHPLDHCAPEGLEELHHMYPSKCPEWLSNVVIRASIKNSESKSSGVISETLKIVGTLRRWLWSKHGETRELPTIPPQELDVYLAEFFSKLRTHEGFDFDPRFFNNLRSSLCRYLLEHGYAYSITKSTLFSSSCMAFSEKKKILRLKK